MAKLPNKMLQAAYDAALDKTFTWSPTYQRFTDQHGNSDYNYSAMLWLKDNGFFVEQPYNPDDFVLKFRLK